MKLGLMWGSGIGTRKVDEFAAERARTGGWRGRFGTEIWPWDDLTTTLQTEEMVWTNGLTYWDFLSSCTSQGLPVLLCIDPMNPGSEDGTGYHQSALDAEISFPEFKVEDLTTYAQELLELIAQDFPSLELAGVQFGNEVEYMPYVVDWHWAYRKYFRGLEALAEVVSGSDGALSVVTGGISGGATTTDLEAFFGGEARADTQASLTWYCAERWRLDLPLILNFHSLLTAPTCGNDPPVPGREDANQLAAQITDWTLDLKGTFPNREVFLTECGGYSYFDELGTAGYEAGLDGFWGIAGQWLVECWGVRSDGKQDLRQLGCFGESDWDNRPTRESFVRLAELVSG